MYKINSYVRYGAKGIFKISDIIEKKDKDGHLVKWYVMNSMKNGIETSVVTPAVNDAIRNILNRKETQHLLDEIPALETIWNENKTIRYQNFHSIIESGSIRKLAQLAKTLYLIRDEKEANGKQIAEKDREFLERAQQLLFEEISLSFDIKEDEVLDRILNSAGLKKEKLIQKS